MSYDIDIGGEDFNYTWNLGRLFYDFIPAVDSERGGLHELHGKTGSQARDILSGAFDRMNHSDAVHRQRYDAPNGWGSTAGAILFLARIMAACNRHPRSKVSLWT